MYSSRAAIKAAKTSTSPYHLEVDTPHIVRFVASVWDPSLQSDVLTGLSIGSAEVMLTLTRKPGIPQGVERCLVPVHEALLVSYSPVLAREVEVTRQRRCIDGAWAVSELAPGKDEGRAPPEGAMLPGVRIVVETWPEAFKEVVAWMYGTPLNISFERIARWAHTGCDLLEIAQDFGIDPLERLIRGLLIEGAGRASLDAAWALLEVATRYDLAVEAEACAAELAFLGSELLAPPAEAFGLPSFGCGGVAALSLDALDKLMRSPGWVVDSEDQIFELLNRWLVANYEENLQEQLLLRASEWSLRWGLLTLMKVEALVKKGILPQSLIPDCRSWRRMTNRLTEEEEEAVPDPEKIAEEERRRKEEEEEAAAAAAAAASGGKKSGDKGQKVNRLRMHVAAARGAAKQNENRARQDAAAKGGHGKGHQADKEIIDVSPQTVLWRRGEPCSGGGDADSDEESAEPPPPPQPIPQRLPPPPPPLPDEALNFLLGAGAAVEDRRLLRVMHLYRKHGVVTEQDDGPDAESRASPKSPWLGPRFCHHMAFAPPMPQSMRDSYFEMYVTERGRTAARVRGKRVVQGAKTDSNEPIPIVPLQLLGRRRFRAGQHAMLLRLIVRWPVGTGNEGGGNVENDDDGDDPFGGGMSMQKPSVSGGSTMGRPRVARSKSISKGGGSRMGAPRGGSSMLSARSTGGGRLNAGSSTQRTPSTMLTGRGGGLSRAASVAGARSGSTMGGVRSMSMNPKKSMGGFDVSEGNTVKDIVFGHLRLGVATYARQTSDGEAMMGTTTSGGMMANWGEDCEEGWSPVAGPPTTELFPSRPLGHADVADASPCAEAAARAAKAKNAAPSKITYIPSDFLDQLQPLTSLGEPGSSAILDLVLMLVVDADEKVLKLAVDPVLADGSAPSADFFKGHRFFQWGDQEVLSSKLKEAAPIESRAGGHFKFCVELDAQGLAAEVGDNGSVELEVLPRAAFQRSWWIDAMGRSADSHPRLGNGGSQNWAT